MFLAALIPNFASEMVHKLRNIDEFNAFFHQPTLHPLMSVGNLAQAQLTLFEPVDFDMYCVVLMDINFGDLVLGNRIMNYGAGTVFTLRPGQVVSMNLNYAVKPQGWMLAFRPELLEKSGLGRDFHMFSFLQHDVAQALELSAMERGAILNSFANLYAELQTPSDYLTNHMLRLGIGHLLSYCKRFFERQYAERVKHKSDLRQRLDTLIDNYLSSGSTSQTGQPTVAWCAGEFNLSPNYFGDMVRRELQVSAQDYIQQKIVEAAQRLLSDRQLSINAVAEELGFAYANHFTRMFKNNTGLTPLEWRRRNNIM